MDEYETIRVDELSVGDKIAPASFGRAGRADLEVVEAYCDPEDASGEMILVSARPPSHDVVFRWRESRSRVVRRRVRKKDGLEPTAVLVDEISSGADELVRSVVSRGDLERIAELRLVTGGEAATPLVRNGFTGATRRGWAMLLGARTLTPPESRPAVDLGGVDTMKAAIQEAIVDLRILAFVSGIEPDSLFSPHANPSPGPCAGVYVVHQSADLSDEAVLAAFPDESEADELVELLGDPDGRRVTYEPVYRTAADCVRDLELDVERERAAAGADE